MTPCRSPPLPEPLRDQAAGAGPKYHARGLIIDDRAGHGGPFFGFGTPYGLSSLHPYLITYGKETRPKPELQSRLKPAGAVILRSDRC
jgi:hypothetical protein